MSILDKIKAIFKKKPSAEATEPMEEDSGIGQEEAPVLPTQGEGLEPEPEPEPEAEPKTEKEGKPEEPAATADEESPLAEAIAFAEAKLAEKKDELTPAELEMFKAKLSSYADKVGKDEEEALSSVSQLIGAITKSKAPKKKHEPEAEPEAEPEIEPEAEPEPEKEAAQEKPAATADQGSQLAKAIAFAEAKLAEKEDMLTTAEVEMFKAKLSSYADKVGKDEEDALVSVSQLIGAIAQAKPPQKKPEAEPEPAEPKKKSTAKKKAPANKKSTAKKKAPANK